KIALRSDLSQRLQALSSIDLQLVTSNNKGYSLVDLRKVLAFQMGQTLALNSGEELYTKRGIMQLYPKLTPYLERLADADMQNLNDLLKCFLLALAERLPKMKRT